MLNDLSGPEITLRPRSSFDGFAACGDWATLSLIPIASETRTAARRNVFLETTNLYFL
jgi:hypothetical protein